jgi:hypothetical protein
MDGSQQRWQVWLTDFITKHWLGLLICFVGALASIAALALGIWPIVPKRVLIYSVQPVRTAIVQVNQASDITLFYKGKRINGDLTAAQIMIGNSGKEPIEDKDILVPITLVVSNAEILERSFSAAPLAGTDFILSTNLASGRLEMNWRILERGDTPIIQILYAGKRDLPIVLEGRIKGQTTPKQVSWPRKEKPKIEELCLVAVAYLFLLPITFSFWRGIRKQAPLSLGEAIAVIIATISVPILIFFIILNTIYRDRF